jgi:site-specific recombinase XerD
MNKNKNTNNIVINSITLNQFGDYASGFLQSLADQNHAAGTIGQYRCFINALAGTMHAKGISIEELDEALVVDLAAETGWRSGRSTYAVFIARRFVQFLNDHGAGKPPPPPTAKDIARAELKSEYESYLRCQRGLSERTIFHCWRYADRFLNFRFGDEAGDLSQIRPSDIAAFLQYLTRRKKPFRDKTGPTHLRNFFRYLFKAGKTANNLALGIPRVRQQYGARLPRHLSPDQVETLLGAIHSGSSCDRRNYAMVLMMARLGLRAPEVIAMQIDDIDWCAGEIMVRGKGDRHDRVPLPVDLGEAIADYLTHDRGQGESRALFVTDRAPYRPLNNGQILNNLLRAAFAATGLKPPAPYVGSHVLRHSLAVNLVRRGASLEEIGDMLRHRSRESTMIYARLDIDGLRSIAQPWPVAGGAK